MSDHQSNPGFDGSPRHDGVPLSDRRAERGLRRTHEILGRKWALPIVFYLLKDGTLRFSELADRIDGISKKMLADNLSHLETYGVVDRTVAEERVRVTYSLTERGRRLSELVTAAATWGGDVDAADDPVDRL